MNVYSRAWKNYFNFADRANRTEYWLFVLINLVISLAVLLIGGLLGKSIGLALYWLFTMATLIPSLSLCVRRLHDTNRSGWWFLIVLVPFVGGIILFILFLLAGTSGANRFGNVPN